MTSFLQNKKNHCHTAMDTKLRSAIAICQSGRQFNEFELALNANCQYGCRMLMKTCGSLSNLTIHSFFFFFWLRILSILTHTLEEKGEGFKKTNSGVYPIHS